MSYQIIFFTDLSTRFWHAKSLGAYRLASELRSHGYTVKVVDFFGHWLQDARTFFQLLDTLIGPETLFVAFSSTFYSKNLSSDPLDINSWRAYSDYGQLHPWPVSTDRLQIIFKTLHKKFPHVKLVYGGDQASYREVNAVVDYVIKGLADTTIVELANSMMSNGSVKYMPTGSRAKLINYDTQASSFDFAHSMTDFHASDHVFPGEVLPMETSRGCLFKCSFCGYPLIGRKKGDPDYHKNVQTMAQEFKNNHQKHGVSKYMFVDDTFNETTAKLQDIMRARDLSGVDVRFSAYLRTDLIDRFPEQIDLLKNLGIETAFLGIESLYQPSALAIGKGSRPETIKETIHKMRQQWGPEVRIVGSFIVGLPYDNPETLHTWIPWVENPACPIDYPWFTPLNVGYGETTELPSDISRSPEKFGYTLHADNSWSNQYWDSRQAGDYVMDIMERFWSRGRLRVAGWDFLGFQNYGYRPEEIATWTLDSIDWKKILQDKDDMWTRYRRAVLEYEQV